MKYTFEEWTQLTFRAGMPDRHGRQSRAAYASFLASGVVWSLWLYWFRRNGA